MTAKYLCDTCGNNLGTYLKRYNTQDGKYVEEYVDCRDRWVCPKIRIGGYCRGYKEVKHG